MTPSEKGLEIGKLFNEFLREKKQIPHATPKIFNPRIQGWLNGFCDGIAEASELNEDDAHALRSAVYINMFDGSNTGQRMGLDTLSERQRILSTGPTLGYNAIFFEFAEKGKADGITFAQNPEHELLLYSLL
ncbi:MAG: hypothetical protein ACPGU4_08190 [Flavobacteriales bacterium]